MSSRWLGYTSLIVAVVLLFAVNIFGAGVLPGTRIDLTENRLYTLSKGTHSVLDKLDEPITIRFYLSQTLATRIPSIGTYAERVKELCPIIEIRGPRYPVLGALWQPRGGTARHDAVAWGYARAADQLGVDILENTEVVGFLKDADVVVGVEVLGEPLERAS